MCFITPISPSGALKRGRTGFLNSNFLDNMLQLDETATFEDLGLSADLLRALDDKGYKNPTPIQRMAIPNVLMSRDLVGLAQTGTGKTASFTLPMIEILAGGRARSRMPRSLVLEPTRELAAQVAENFDTYGKYHKLTKALLVGGESMSDQMKLLERGVDVLIATPGRLIDLFDRGSILLSDIRILVIDEADRMLDMGFIPDIEKIVSKISPTRQTLLFSATMPAAIEDLTNKFLSNPRRVSVAPQSTTAATVNQSLVWLNDQGKKPELLRHIDTPDVKNAFVFCNRKKDVAELARFLQGRGIQAAALHGDMIQSARTQTLQKFKEGLVTILVCSDVAARGLDIQGVSHVFNYDVPFNAEDYVHRIGRTGRAGQSGCSITFATQDEVDNVEAIEKLIGRKISVQGAVAHKTDHKAAVAAASDKNVSGSKNAPNRYPAPKPQKGALQQAQDEEASCFGDDVPSFLLKR